MKLQLFKVSVSNLHTLPSLQPSCRRHPPFFLRNSDLAAAVIREDWKLCVIAGNISPIDVITHVPILYEESDIPYVYVPSKEDLANAGETKRPTCCVLVLTKPCKGGLKPEEEEKLKADYQQVVADVSELASLLY